MADKYYIITAKPWEDSTDDGPEVSAEDLRTILEQLHLVQRHDKIAQFYEAAKAVGYTPWELARLKEALADATEVLDDIADQINRLEEARDDA